MTSIPMIDLFTIVFVRVDDWYKSEGIKFRKKTLLKTAILQNDEFLKRTP